MIYYFSGTGNSRWVAEKLAKLTNDTAADIAPRIRDKACTEAVTAGPGERIGLVFPVHAWGAPKIVDEFVAAVTVDKGAYAYAVCTCGDDAGRAMQRLHKRFAWQAAWSVSMPNNYLPMYDVDAPALAAEKLAAAREKLPRIAEAVNARQAVTDIRSGAFAGIKTAVVHPLFSTFAVSTKPFFADDGCTGCGLCARICPRGAIRMADGKPVWEKSHCLQCMACIQRCPVRAIQYGEGTRAKGRYHCTEPD